ncbi:MAG TPA: disulfide bond formation protein DsbA, partial [Acidimicrobiaceae bacterium]|nr:disulfide bond formation protein DsbA [Acidimicrobiaceae bacterium]
MDEQSLNQSAVGPPDLEFFWDPVCPFAWQTSRWLRRVADLR